MGLFSKGRSEIIFFLIALQQCWWFRFWLPTRLRYYVDDFIFSSLFCNAKRKISLVLAAPSDGRIPVLLGQQQRHPGRGRVAALGAQGQYMEFLQIIFFKRLLRFVGLCMALLRRLPADPGAAGAVQHRVRDTGVGWLGFFYTLVRLIAYRLSRSVWLALLSLSVLNENLDTFSRHGLPVGGQERSHLNFFSNLGIGNWRVKNCDKLVHSLCIHRSPFAGGDPISDCGAQVESTKTVFPCIKGAKKILFC